ncbi:hypothetical protein ABFS82_12G070800 [Erythranthe guttata]|uniref:putative 1-phosphatidylinositol-3-phosphate 5-kinase FAB1C n=1 Tax=Erythranthe guttata TaxID=4155 RepID=UPI00064E0718|nr:PREDICTED: putative 1-phosphatidylinositol-3-phosphate 5-kinase FAB1C [Erythranthe guttata]|eukprot:XP_012827271.1 PREDICTED: putative 1-phosphatidylinositol-3-phosphate 5-kinase FAB1C [Erythranthe guttata]
MGMYDSSLLYFIQKVRSLIPCGNSDSDSILRLFETMENTCCHCKSSMLKSDIKYHCQNCASLLCRNCIQALASFDESILTVKSCKFCFELSPLSKSGQRYNSGKVHPSESPRQSPEPPSPSFSGDSPLSLRCSTIRSDEEEGENSTSHFLSTPYEYFRDDSDVDSISAKNEFYTLDNEQAVLESPAGNKETPPQQTLDFEANGTLIWFPPPADDISDEVENGLFTYADEDDDVGESGDVFLPSAAGIDDALFSDRDKQKSRDDVEPWRGAVEGHFRALVSQILQGQGVISDQDNGAHDWLDIVTAIAWQSAKFVKPDTSGGGSMDPCDYLKVKCVASGVPKESKLIKGIVCTKNIKHKRMTSQYKNARLLLLGGALEYQRVPNQLESFETLLQQENDYLKTIVSRIEAHRPNVLLVEKSVSSFALEHLLEKEISLVLNVKRPLLERIARCSGASVTPTTNHISTARLGHCELFHLEKVSEEHEPPNQFNKKPSKTLMFFQGCPRRLGCTIVLRGSSREELKKVKQVVQYAVFAAYHLSLETSFLSDEGATLPKYSSTKSSTDLALDLGLNESLSELDYEDEDISSPNEFTYREALYEACDENLALKNATEPQNHEVESPLKFDDTPHSILVSFSSHCVTNGTVCERSRLIRLKFYGPSDKPLGRYLRDDLFNQSNQCRSCKESAEAHVMCYTHQHANVTINVKRLPSVKLPGEQDGKIWMWHRCLKCEYIEGVPQANRRVIMSDSAWGLSFGKFLELSFSNHSTGNRVASCGHSLQRDCLRFYGCGSMVAFFRYSTINVLSVRLPPSILEFGGTGEQMWIRREAYELSSKARDLHAEISDFLEEFKAKSLSAMDEFSDASELHRHVLELDDILFEEKSYYQNMLQIADENIREQDQAALDILEINRLRHSLVISSQVWDRRIYSLDSLLKRSSSLNDVASLARSKEYSDTYFKDSTTDVLGSEDSIFEYAKPEDYSSNENYVDENTAPLERLPSAASILSDKIDSAWSGADVAPPNVDPAETTTPPSFARISHTRPNMAPTRVYSFDSAQRLQERMSKGLPPSSLYLSTLRSFHASGDYRSMVRDPVAHVQRTFSQGSLRESERLNLSPSSFISSATSLLPDGARLMVPQNDVVLTVFDKEPTSIISYALSSKKYEDWISDRPNGPIRKVNSLASNLSTWHSFGSMDLDYINYTRSYTSEEATDHSSNSSPHVRISFEDESSNLATKVKFSVTCYYAKRFDSLRGECCPGEVDFIRSLSRCRRWSAQGGKSNVYFAKSFDERFVIKQVTKTELDSFEEFAPEYFKYLTDALSSGSPTSLAKVLGIYQVTVKHMRGGKEVKMDLMVMENLFFGRSISKVYDLKGSVRSRYNSDTTGANKVLLDTNLLETLRTNPIFLGSKAKRILERAVWNDTSFLASVDVMDYSLLVGVDEERKEMVIGIIDFMRQYTWDKHLETWVKASGILGGPKNASPTIVSPKQYKKRFRKAMTTYFLTVPDQWSSN